MKTTIITLCLLTSTCAANAQYGPPPYGGPPMWDRRYDPREEAYRWPRTHIGPQMEPCIYYGNCRGPRYEDDPEERWRRPRNRRWERWYSE